LLRNFCLPLQRTDFIDKPQEIGEGFLAQHYQYTKERNIAVVDVDISHKTSFHRYLVEEQHGEILTVLRKSEKPETEGSKRKCIVM
jgi:hypothetical protein